jgi:hypothetical protein
MIEKSNDPPLIEFRRHKDFIMMRWLWKKMRLLLSGSEVVKYWDISFTHGEPRMETFILRPVGEEDAQYNFYVYSARYSDFISRTKAILEGLLFYRSPIMKVPEGMSEYLSNIDMTGTSLVEFAKMVAGEILTMNRGGLYVDYPFIPEGTAYTKAERMAKDIRPFTKFARAERCFYWEYSVINNVRTLSRVDIAEDTDEDTSEEEWHLVRSLTLELNEETGKYEYWNSLYTVSWTKELSKPTLLRQFKLFFQLGDPDSENNSGYLGQLYSRVKPLKDNGTAFDHIPFWFTSLVYDQTHMDKSPLNEVADANIAHYRLCADIQSALFHCAHPTPVFSGFHFDDDKHKVVLGSMQGISSPDPGASAKYLELTGNSISELRAERDAVIKELAALGARSLSTAAVNSQTAAETTQINASGDTAVLNTLAGTMNSIFIQALKVMAEFQGEDTSGITFDMNREFMPSKLASNEIAVLLNAVLQKAMSIEDFIEILQTGGTLRQSISAQEYVSRLQKPSIAVGASAGTTGVTDSIPQAGMGEGSTIPKGT